ncbi:carboxy-S-adenosyl-L-methionine synthase CmoA, partial [Campylobacter coli]
RQGYSKIEIAAKREALENVLIPYSEKENLDMLKNAGFEKIESVFKWVNFETFIAFK